MSRKSLVAVLVAILILGTVSLPAAALGPGIAGGGPVVAGRVVSIDTTAQTIRIRSAVTSTTVAVDATTIIVGIDEGWPSREGTIVAFSAIRVGDLASAIVKRPAQPDGSYLAVSIVIKHRSFQVTGRVRSIDATAQVFTVSWVNWRRQTIRRTIHYNSATKVRQRGRLVPFSRMKVNSIVHVAGYVSNDGLIATGIKILWSRRVGQANH